MTTNQANTLNFDIEIKRDSFIRALNKFTKTGFLNTEMLFYCVRLIIKTHTHTQTPFLPHQHAAGDREKKKAQ